MNDAGVRGGGVEREAAGVSSKAQLELAIDRPFTREASLALDRAVAADDVKKARALRRQAEAVSQRFVSCLNRRDATRLELCRILVPARRRALEARLTKLYAEQDEFEEQLTRLSALFSA